MFTPPSLNINTKALDWSKRTHVQNALTVLENGGTEDFKIDDFPMQILTIAGSADTWPLESERATELATSKFSLIKAAVLTGVRQSNPLVVAGALDVALRFHTDSEHRNGDGTGPLSAEERQIIIDVANSFYQNLQFRHITNQLSKMCTCWMALEEMETAYSKVTWPRPQISLEQITLESNDHAYKRGREIFIDGRGIIVLGMSVGSSRFNASRTEAILEWLSTTAPDSLLMITDRPARHNRQALGDTDAEVQQYCLKKGRQLREYANVVLDQPGNRMQIFDWDTTYRTLEFQDSLEKLNALYRSSVEFRSDVQDQSRRVLSRESGRQDINEEEIEIAKNYLLEEFAAIEAFSQIKQCAVGYAYYTSWKPFQRWVSGEYDGQERNLGFVQYSIQSEDTSLET